MCKTALTIWKTFAIIEQSREWHFIFIMNAEVSELADAQASGACGRKIVWVQVPFPAFFFILSKIKRSCCFPEELSSGRQQLFYFFHFSSTKYQEKSKTRVLSHFRYDVVSSKNNTFPKQKEDLIMKP